MASQESKGFLYLGLPTSKDIHHDLHHCLVHPKCPHEIRVLVKHFIIHDIPRKDNIGTRETQKSEQNLNKNVSEIMINLLEIITGMYGKVSAIIKP